MRLTVITYHYVRRPERTQFPRIKALHTDAFAEHLRGISRRYRPISGDDLMHAIVDAAPFPDRAILLTFDDGFRDCITNVAPLLRQLGIRACFFPVSGCIRDGVVADVHKVQFLLAVVRVPVLLDHLRAAVAESGTESWEALWTRFAHPSRWDPADVQFIKKLLQFALPSAIRIPIVDGLFRRFVTGDEGAFSHELYCGRDDLLALRDEGHTLGSHGHRHLRLDHCSAEERALEIGESLSFLQSLGVSRDWMIAYPHGAVDAGVLAPLAAAGFKVGFTTEARVADLETDNHLSLPRLDANDVPHP